MPRIALVTAIAAHTLDEDMPSLLAACAQAGIAAEIRAWDDPTVSWARYTAALLRSAWDYHLRLPEFLAWCERVSRSTCLINPLTVLLWNTDKHYLADLATAGVTVVPCAFVEPEAEPLPALRGFLAAHPATAEFVVKPAVGAGSHDAQRYTRAQEFAAANHIARLLEAGHSALLQPYLPSIDSAGETALVYLGGAYSHAVCKGPLLQPGTGPTAHLFAPEVITLRTPGDDERTLADTTLAAISRHLRLDTPPIYARVDLIRGADGAPCLLELELTEPSLFFAHAPAAAQRFADLLAARLAGAADTVLGRVGASR